MADEPNRDHFLALVGERGGFDSKSLIRIIVGTLAFLVTLVATMLLGGDLGLPVEVIGTVAFLGGIGMAKLATRGIKAKEYLGNPPLLWFSDNALIYRPINDGEEVSFENQRLSRSGKTLGTLTLTPESGEKQTLYRRYQAVDLKHLLRRAGINSPTDGWFELKYLLESKCLILNYVRLVRHGQDSRAERERVQWQSLVEKDAVDN